MNMLAFLLSSILLLGVVPAARADGIRARAHNSGFPQSHTTYNGISAASDGNIYYVLSTTSIDVGAKMYRFDPTTNKIEYTRDLTEACGEKDLKAIPHGKSHVSFVEAGGKLYFATHVGYYSVVGGMERIGKPLPGYKPYPGGHILAYDLRTRRFEDHGIARQGEGIISMTMDPARMRVYGLTWPSAAFFRYDVARREYRDFGKVSADGEDGSGPTYRAVCRSLVVSPDDGSVYFTTADGDIFRYRFADDTLRKVEGDNLRKDYLGAYEPWGVGHLAYNWRQAFWHAATRSIYAVHGHSGYLFRFDPRQERVEVLDRITSEPSRRSGMFDQFGYGYLGFALGPDGQTIHYLTGGRFPGAPKGQENLHLVTWHIPTARYNDRGPIFLEDGQRPALVNSIAVAKDGAVYAIATFSEKGQSRADLISFPGPLAKKR